LASLSLLIAYNAPCLPKKVIMQMMAMYKWFHSGRKNTAYAIPTKLICTFYQ
jgi:hypothetical protein